MKNLQPAIDLIKQFEGCKLTAYQDSVGIWTIGYGSTLNVAPGQTITQEQAEQMLMEHLEPLSDHIEDMVRTPTTNNQHCALCCFAYNVGAGALERSTLLKKLQSNDIQGAADEFLKWDKAGGRVLPGLTRRREAERALFLTA
jgi:lysozyme